MSKLWRSVTAAVVFLSACVPAALSVAPASAAPPVIKQEHFVLITTSVVPRWTADMQLYAQDRTLVYSWKQPWRSGGRARANWTWYGDKGWLDVKVTSSSILGNGIASKTHLSLDRDYCFKVNWVGDVWYTGDSVTGGCTSD